MVKRILAVIMAIMLTVGCLAGCGGDKASGGKKGEATKGVDLPELEITSDKVRYLCWEAQETLDDKTTASGFINDLLKTHYGCGLEVVKTTYEDLTQKAVQMILSGDSPDVVFFKMADFPNFILNGIVEDVSNHIDTSDPFWDYLDTNPLKYQGVTYNCYVGTKNNGMTYFNTKMFKNAGLETPYELFKKGEWTWEKYYELAKALTQDTDGDGTTDIFGGDVSPLYFYTTCGEDFVTINDDGTFSNNMRSANIQKVMNFMHNLDQAGYQGGDIWKGTAAMMVDEAWQVTGRAEELLNGSIAIAPSPRMSKDEDWYVNGGYTGMWLCKGAKNPGGAMAHAAVQHWINVSEEGKKVHEEYKEKNLKYPEEVQDVLDWLNEKENTTRILGRAAGVGNFGQDSIFKMFNDTCEWDVPWATTVESMYPVLQTQIDTINVKLAKANEY